MGSARALAGLFCDELPRCITSGFLRVAGIAAAGFLRSQVAHRLTIRKVPELHFAYDESVERGVRLSKLIDDAVGTPAAPDPAPAAPAPAKPRRTRGGGASH